MISLLGEHVSSIITSASPLSFSHTMHRFTASFYYILHTKHCFWLNPPVWNPGCSHTHIVKMSKNKKQLAGKWDRAFFDCAYDSKFPMDTYGHANWELQTRKVGKIWSSRYSDNRWGLSGYSMKTESGNLQALYTRVYTLYVNLNMKHMLGIVLHFKCLKIA